MSRNVYFCASAFLIPMLFLASAPRGVSGQETGSNAGDGAEKTEGSPAKGKASPEGADSGKELPAGVLAIVNGREITVDEYVGYLLASIGKSRLDEYINRLLLDEEARQLGVSIEPQEVESAVDERIQRTIKSLYLGKQEDYVADLARRRSDLESEKARLRQDLYYDRLQDRVVFARRKVSSEDVRRYFERVYGDDGVQYVLRHILIATRGRGDASNKEKEATAGKTSGKIIRRSPGEARERAEAIRKEIQGGMEFVQAVKQYSDDSFTKANQGRIPHYRKGFFGDGFHAAVEALSPENPVSGVVESPRGYHIIQLVEKRVTKFEDVQTEVEKAVENLPPSPQERQKLVRELRSKAKIEGL